MTKTMSIRMDKENYEFLSEMSRGELEAGNHQPLCLWLIPIHLRSRKQYYDDAVAATRKLIKWYWQTSRSIYPVSGSKARILSGEPGKERPPRGGA